MALYSCGPFKFSRVVIADIQILGSAFFFGIGFLGERVHCRRLARHQATVSEQYDLAIFIIGQRAVSVNGLGPMTCNAFRFGLSTILLVAILPILPPDLLNAPDEAHEKSDDDKHAGSNSADSAEGDIKGNKGTASFPSPISY
jgi:hypothetical protein